MQLSLWKGEEVSKVEGHTGFTCSRLTSCLWWNVAGAGSFEVSGVSVTSGQSTGYIKVFGYEYLSLL